MRVYPRPHHRGTADSGACPTVEVIENLEKRLRGTGWRERCEPYGELPASRRLIALLPLADRTKKDRLRRRSDSLVKDVLHDAAEGTSCDRLDLRGRLVEMVRVAKGE